MPRGGPRPGAGRKKGTTKDVLESTSPAAIERQAKAVKMSPLEYMLTVMNDALADESRRDRMAQAAAPYVHGKPGEQAKGKKEEQQDAADRAATGKFAVPQAPKLVVDNRR